MILIALGSVSSAPTNRTSAKGTNFVGFTLDVPGYGGKTDKLSCMAYGKTMETASRLSVGQTVQVTGLPSARKRDYNGQTYANLCLMVNQVEFSGNGHAAPAPQYAPPPAGYQPIQQPTQQPSKPPYEPGDDTDIPF